MNAFPCRDLLWRRAQGAQRQQSTLCQTVAMLPCFAALQVLDVSGNPLGSVPPFFSCLQSLHKLLFAGTHMQLLPAFISSLTKLEHLNLASNKLQVGLSR